MFGNNPRQIPSARNMGGLAGTVPNPGLAKWPHPCNTPAARPRDVA